MCSVYTPFVYWAQNKNTISLKVELISVKNVNVYLNEKQLKFFASGKGARGLNNYSFSLHFYSNIDYEASSYEILDRQISFILVKKLSEWWPRLTCEPQKPPWLKVDFDKWESDYNDGLTESTRGVCEDYPDIYDKLHKEEFGYKKEDLKKVYLIFYNLFQCIGFMYILIVMGIKYYRDGPEYLKKTYETVGNPYKFLQILQFLEVMYPLFKYTKGVTTIIFLQFCSKAFVLFCMIEAEPRMQTKPVVFYVFLIWTTVEVIRYPYYISRLLNLRIFILTWLRYTAWIPLYPLGFVFEGIIVIRNIPYFEETEKFTVTLPNSWNFAFHFPTFLRLYLIILCIPGMLMVISHLNGIRFQKVGRNKKNCFNK